MPFSADMHAPPRSQTHDCLNPYFSLNACTQNIAIPPPNAQQGALGRTKLNEKYNMKEISKPHFVIESGLGGGFTCTLTCKDIKTNKEHEVNGLGTSKAGSKENAARALLGKIIVVVHL